MADEWGRIRAAFEFCIREALRDLTQRNHTSKHIGLDHE